MEYTLSQLMCPERPIGTLGRAVRHLGNEARAAPAVFGTLWCRRAEKLAEIPRTARLGWHSLRRKFVNDMKADTPSLGLQVIALGHDGQGQPLSTVTGR